MGAKVYTRKVVYDCDDVLIGLNEVAHKIVGIDLDRRVYYNVRKETHFLTSEQMDSMIQVYNDVETFKRAKFYDGSDDILEIEKQGLAEVYIHSLSYQQDIVDYKDLLLRDKYKELPKERFWLEYGERKSVMENIDILVEDSIENVMKSKAKLGNILIRKTYNRPKNYGTSLEELRAIEVSNLKQANMVVKHLLTGAITLY